LGNETAAAAAAPLAATDGSAAVEGCLSVIFLLFAKNARNVTVTNVDEAKVRLVLTLFISKYSRIYHI
jgi:hypothetical protein